MKAGGEVSCIHADFLHNPRCENLNPTYVYKFTTHNKVQ
jgi:hypothetical protein